MLVAALILFLCAKFAMLFSFFVLCTMCLRLFLCVCVFVCLQPELYYIVQVCLLLYFCVKKEEQRTYAKRYAEQEVYCIPPLPSSLKSVLAAQPLSFSSPPVASTPLPQKQSSSSNHALSFDSPF